MKQIALINGSPRKNGNTRLLLKIFTDVFAEKNPHTRIDFIDAASCDLKPCLACGSCRKNGGNCVTADETAALMNTIADADAFVFATPVYWWGVTAQIKTFIDKMYSKGEHFAQGAAKKIGVIVTGDAELADRQYELIKGQFECICDYLGWEFVFYQSVSAGEAGEVAKQAETLAKTAALAASL